MSWRRGSNLFLEMWPLIKKYIPDRDHRLEITSGLIRLLVDSDMDPYDIEDVDPEIREAMRLADIEIAEPDRYADNPSA